MARREVIDCDRCGLREATEAQRIVMQTGWQVGVDGSEPRHEEVYLCPACLGVLLQEEVRGWESLVGAEQWIKAIREHLKKGKNV